MSLRICARRLGPLTHCRLTKQFMLSNWPALCVPIQCLDYPKRSVSSLRNCLFSKHSNENNTSSVSITPNEYERITEDTLETLTEYFEELIEESSHFNSPDVIYGDGVLTVHLGEPYGTYVINRQSPNLQIWLSSPTSGPKRYDFVDGHWVYRHDGVSLHDLLNEEISKIVHHPVDFKRCSFSKSSNQK